MNDTKEQLAIDAVEGRIEWFTDAINHTEQFNDALAIYSMAKGLLMAHLFCFPERSEEREVFEGDLRSTFDAAVKRLVR